jgi:two-component system cell cycle sensor histidine kinase/response regulator CckA
MPPGTELSASLPSPGPLVRAGPRDIDQLLTNLVTNAWEAAEPGSASIHLTVSSVRPAEIPREHRFPAGWLPSAAEYGCIAVRDEGPGIEPGRLNEIFDPFYSSKTFGRGLGLAVAMGTVKAHQGGMSVETRPGGGATFAVYLPVAQSPKEDAAAPESGEGSAGVVRREGPPPRTDASTDGPTVLVVDDNEMLRKLAARILGRMGFRALEAADGIEALSVVQEHRERIRVVLCDVTMPRMGGWETLAALRRIDPRLPVILTSGYDDAIDAGGIHEERPDAFVGKPWRLDALRAALTEAVGRPRGGQAPRDPG